MIGDFLDFLQDLDPSPFKKIVLRVISILSLFFFIFIFAFTAKTAFQYGETSRILPILISLTLFSFLIFLKSLRHVIVPLKRRLMNLLEPTSSKLSQIYTI